MVDWQIKTMADRCQSRGSLFNPGDRVACLIYQDKEASELRRLDLLEDAVADYTLPGELLGRWVRLVGEPDAEAGSAADGLQSAEELFLSLYEAEREAAALTEKQALQHLLALLLERKRVLRPLPPRQVEGTQTYLHVKSKRSFAVPVIEISAPLMARIEDSIGDLIH